MPFNKIAPLCVLALLAVVSIALPTSQASGLSLKVNSGCKILAPPQVGPSPTNTVSMKGECFKAGHTILTVVKYSYQQTDYAGAECNSVSNKPGRSFIPQTKGTFYVLANFTVAPLYKSSGVKPRSTGWIQLKLGHWQLQCGKLDASSSPSPGSLCDFSLPHLPVSASLMQNSGGNVANDVCGQVTRDHSYQGQIPQWNGLPLIVGNSVFSPSIASPGGSCVVKPQGPKGQWMAQTVQYETWVCAGGFVVAPMVTVYYYPPGSTAVCQGAKARPSDDFTAGEDTLFQGGEYAHFSLPADWQTWGGKLIIVYTSQIFDQGGLLTNRTIGHEYAGRTVNLSGSANGCAELTS